MTPDNLDADSLLVAQTVGSRFCLAEQTVATKVPIEGDLRHARLAPSVMGRPW